MTREKMECEITEPADGTIFGKGDVINIAVEARDPNGNNLEVQFLLNNEGIGSTHTFPYSFSWDTDEYEKGEYLISTTVISSNGDVGEDSVRIQIDISTPRVETSAVLAVQLTSAHIEGYILSDGGAPISESGFYWGRDEQPEINGEKWLVQPLEGEMETALTGLSTNTSYYFRAFAKNEKGEAFGELNGFQTRGNEIGEFTDSRDGKVYQWVRIENQTWMAENLAFLPSVNPPDDESTIYEKQYVYGYDGSDPTEAKTYDTYGEYGALYNWKAALNSCPAGWHLPTDAEWMTLEKNLGMTEIQTENAGWRGSFEGRLMKSESGWDNGGNGSNISDFNAIPGGYRLTDDSFKYLGVYANWWTATEYDNKDGWNRNLYWDNNGVYRGSFGKEYGFSVRCVKD